MRRAAGQELYQENFGPLIELELENPKKKTITKSQRYDDISLSLFLCSPSTASWLLLLLLLKYCPLPFCAGSGNGLLERSLQYSSFQNVFFSTGGGTLRNAAIGFVGILISGRNPSGGGSKRCGVGDLRAVAGEPGALPRPVGGAKVLCCGGGGRGAT